MTVEQSTRFAERVRCACNIADDDVDVDVGCPSTSVLQYPSGSDYTILDAAAKGGHDKIVKFLLDNGADASIGVQSQPPSSCCERLCVSWNQSHQLHTPTGRKYAVWHAFGCV